MKEEIDSRPKSCIIIIKVKRKVKGDGRFQKDCEALEVRHLILQCSYMTTSIC